MSSSSVIVPEEFMEYICLQGLDPHLLNAESLAQLEKYEPAFVQWIKEIQSGRVTVVNYTCEHIQRGRKGTVHLSVETKGQTVKCQVSLPAHLLRSSTIGSRSRLDTQCSAP